MNASFLFSVLLHLICFLTEWVCLIFLIFCVVFLNARVWVLRKSPNFEYEYRRVIGGLTSFIFTRFVSLDWWMLTVVGVWRY